MECAAFHSFTKRALVLINFLPQLLGLVGHARPTRIPVRSIPERATKRLFKPHRWYLIPLQKLRFAPLVIMKIAMIIVPMKEAAPGVVGHNLDTSPSLIETLVGLWH